MTALRWSAKAMTVLAIVGTIWEAGWGDRIGLVVAGFLISCFGIIVVAVSDPGPTDLPSRNTARRKGKQ